MFSRRIIYQVGLSVGAGRSWEFSRKFEERLTLYFVSGPGLTGGEGGGVGGHIKLTSSAPDYDEWADPGPVTALRDFLSSDQSLCFPSLCGSGWSDQAQMRRFVLLQRSSKEILPWTHSLKLMIWLLSSSQQRLTGTVWIWPGSTPANQRGETSPTTVIFDISLEKREMKGEGGKCCGPNNPLFTENSRVWRPNLKGQQLFWCSHQPPATSH